jgi:hypothetical protein
MVSYLINNSAACAGYYCKQQKSPTGLLQGGSENCVELNPQAIKFFPREPSMQSHKIPFKEKLKNLSANPTKKSDTKSLTGQNTPKALENAEN